MSEAPAMTPSASPPTERRSSRVIANIRAASRRRLAETRERVVSVVNPETRERVVSDVTQRALVVRRRISMAKDNVDEKVVKPVEARATAKVSQDTAMGRALLWFLILSGLATVLWLISVLTSSIISNLAAFETLSGRSAMLARVRQRESLTAFGSWAQRTCSADKPWLRETLLCQAVESTDVTSGPSAGAPHTERG